MKQPRRYFIAEFGLKLPYEYLHLEEATEQGFYDWLLAQKHKDTPVGDLANDVSSVFRMYPDRYTKNLAGIRSSMVEACEGAREALREAIKAYKRKYKLKGSK